MRKRIAIVGSGISGMAAAWLLNRKHEVHLFDKRTRLGGHTHTVTHSSDDGEISLDTGFIVFNEKTYPTLTRVFAQLGINTQSIEISRNSAVCWSSTLPPARRPSQTENLPRCSWPWPDPAEDPSAE